MDNLVWGTFAVLNAAAARVYELGAAAFAIVWGN
jgi:hypothetical protein